MENTSEVVESPQETSQLVEDASTNDLRNFLAAQTETQNLETQPEEMNDSQETGESIDPIQPVEEVESEEERLAKRRIRPKNNLDQQVIDLYRSEGFEGTFQEASRIIYGEPQPSAQPAVSEESAPRDVYKESNEKVESIRGEISELTEKVREASENLDTVEALNLQREIMMKELEIQKIETRTEIQRDRERAEFETTQRQKSSESRNRAVSDYPELNDPNSLYRKEFDNFVNQSYSNPDYSPIFQSPKWPEMMAREFAQMKGKQPVMQQQVVQDASRQAAPSVGNQSRVLTSGNTAQPANANAPISDVGQLSNDQLYQLLGQSDGRRYIR